MSMTDPVADLLTRVRNALMVNHEEVDVPCSRLKEGDHVLASYNFATNCGKPNNINMCMSEPKTYEIVEQLGTAFGQFGQQIHDIEVVEQAVDQ